MGERVNDSTQSHVLSKEAIDLAELIDYTRGKAEGYRTFGFSLIRLSKHHEAFEYCEKSLPLFESLNDLDGESSIYTYYGIPDILELFIFWVERCFFRKYSSSPERALYVKTVRSPVK